MSDEKWNFKDEENEENGLFYIENISKKKVLEAVEGEAEVVLEDLVTNKQTKGYGQQLWYKDTTYDLDAIDYFMLKNFKDFDYVLTAENSTEIKLEMQGNISLSWIVN